MTRTAWSDADVAAARFHRHGLTGAARDVADAARRCAGLQAQDLAASRLMVRPRTSGLTVDDVTRAVDDRAVVRTWLMRGTLHAVPAGDVRWLVRLLGPAIRRRDRRRRLQLGLDDELCERALRVLPEVLAGRCLRRADLVTELSRAGVRIDPEDQAPAHLLLFAATSGVVCRGPDGGTGPTYGLLDDLVPATGGSRGPVGPDGPAGPDAVVALVRRHLAAYAPATAEDVATWAGIPLTDVRTAVAELGDELTRVPTARGPLLAPAGTRRPGGGVRDGWRLLPAFDSYLLGYADREPLLDPAHARRVNAGGGWLHPVAVHGGRVAGTWRLRREKRGHVAAVEPFDGPPDAAGTAALEAEADDVGRFLGTEVALRIAP